MAIHQRGRRPNPPMGDESPEDPKVVRLLLPFWIYELVRQRAEKERSDMEREAASDSGPHAAYGHDRYRGSVQGVIRRSLLEVLHGVR